jgi:cytochrome c biogenesis protein CcdA
MHTDLVNIVLGFIEGIALIISPCILPILPIILAGSLAGSKKRPFGIVIGFLFFLGN